MNHVSRRTLPVFAGVLFSLFLLACGLVGVASAQAAGPATVSVRVVGSDHQALLPLTQVTTNETPVVKNSNPKDSCTGTSVVGALQLATEATKGSWSGSWFEGLGYFVEEIDGAGFPPYVEGAPTNYSWSIWLNDKFSTEGVCQAELQPGEQVLFFPACEGTGCPAAPNVLAIEVARVEVHRDAREKTVVAFGNRATPMMFEKMADLEVLEVVATLDFAHRHSGSGCLLPVVVKVAKSPEAESVFYGITGCASTNHNTKVQGLPLPKEA